MTPLIRTLVLLGLGGAIITLFWLCSSSTYGLVETLASGTILLVPVGLFLGPIYKDLWRWVSSGLSD